MNEQIMHSAAGLWKDFDGDGLVLDEHIVSENVTDDGLVRKWVYFNGREADGGVSRVLALVVRKKDKTKLPVLVLVAPSGEPVDEEIAVYWAKKGYAVIAADNAGESDSELFTIYPESIRYANFRYGGRHLTHCDTNAKETAWYEWAVNTRRAVTYMMNEEYADSESVGLVSMRDASIVACMVGAFDKRVSSCAVLFGSCWIDLECNESDDEEERDRWLAAIAPQSYLMFMHTPFYICVGTNSSLTDIDKTYKSLESVPEETPKAMYLVPGMLDDGDDEFFINLDKWFNFTIKNRGRFPQIPEIQFEAENRNLYALVNVNKDECVKGVEVYYARATENKRTRHWVKKTAENLGDNDFRAQLEVMSLSGAGYCFCNVTFKGGFTMSSNLTVVKDRQFAEMELDLAQRTKLVFQGSSNGTQFISYDPTGENDRTFLRTHRLEGKEGPFNIKGIAGTAVSTFALNDIKYIKEENSTLMFDVYSSRSQTLNVYYVRNFATANQSSFHAAVELVGGDIWQKVGLNASDFHSETDKPPTNWSDVQVLAFVCGDEIIINNILFT
jgi:hypothetical protein